MEIKVVTLNMFLRPPTINHIHNDIKDDCR